MRVIVVLALLIAACGGPSTPRPGAYGPYPDRAARDQAWSRLSPWEQNRLMHEALSNPEAARRLQQGTLELPEGEDVELPPELQKMIEENASDRRPGRR